MFILNLKIEKKSGLDDEKSKELSDLDIQSHAPLR